MARLYGQIDLTQLDALRSLAKEVQFKDGSKHMMIRVSIDAMKTPQQDSDHHIKVDVPKELQQEYRERRINTFIGNLKASEQQQPYGQPMYAPQGYGQPYMPPQPMQYGGYPYPPQQGGYPPPPPQGYQPAPQQQPAESPAPAKAPF